MVGGTCGGRSENITILLVTILLLGSCATGNDINFL